MSADLGAPIIHDYPACGKVGLRLRPDLKPGTMIGCSTYFYTRPDGRPLSNIEELRCGACKRYIGGVAQSMAGDEWRAYS